MIRNEAKSLEQLFANLRHLFKTSKDLKKTIHKLLQENILSSRSITIDNVTNDYYYISFKDFIETIVYKTEFIKQKYFQSFDNSHLYICDKCQFTTTYEDAFMKGYYFNNEIHCVNCDNIMKQNNIMKKFDKSSNNYQFFKPLFDLLEQLNTRYQNVLDYVQFNFPNEIKEISPEDLLNEENKEMKKKEVKHIPMMWESINLNESFMGELQNSNELMESGDKNYEELMLGKSFERMDFLFKK